MEEHNAGLVRRAVEEIWNGGDLALADVLFAPGYVNHGGLIPDLVHGPEAITVSVALYRTAFPAFHITVEALTADGALVELAWAAHRSPPAAPAGPAHASPGGTLRGTTRSRMAAGQIVESWTCWDRAAVLHDLGIVPEERPSRGPGRHGSCVRPPRDQRQSRGARR